MNSANTHIPFYQLGGKLRALREKRQESLEEVCGAVEIDEPVLQRIESGHERPSEDILLLLISHFEVQDDFAAELWHLAGYDNPGPQLSTDEKPISDRHEARTQAMMIMIDPRVMYSDSVEITANQQGVVINFGQLAGANQPLTVSRIGMSYDQAKAVMGMLYQALHDAQNPSNSRRLSDGLRTKRSDTSTSPNDIK
jgi:transcriptional regulator with XRE-family HTH domain